MTTLTEEQARAIREDPRPQRTVAEDFGVSQGNIASIKSRGTWRHLEGRVVRTTIEKLLPAQVRDIRNDPRPMWRIALDYGVCASTIGNAKRRVRYAHVA